MGQTIDFPVPGDLDQTETASIQLRTDPGDPPSRIISKLTVEGGATWIKVEPLSGKLQGQTTLTISEQHSLSPTGKSPFMEVGASLTFIIPTGLSGGFSYQGMVGGALDLGGGWAFDNWVLGSLVIRPTLGGFLRSGFYQLNAAENFLFYFSLVAEPGLDIKISDSWDLFISVPLVWDMRIDTALSIGAGIKIGMGIPLKRGTL